MTEGKERHAGEDQTEAAGVVIAFRGQHDAAWVGYYDIRRRAGFGGYASANLSELDVWAALARAAGWWWPGEGLCVMAERPTAVHTEPLAGSRHGELRLHHAGGPAIAFADGFGVNVLHGTPVPEWVLSDPTVDLMGIWQATATRYRGHWNPQMQIAGPAWLVPGTRSVDQGT